MTAAEHSDTASRVVRTAKGRATKEAFHRAGRTLFARSGYPNVTIADIAAEAGKSLGSFYNYFDSKEDLLVELAAGFDTQLQQVTSEPFRAGLPPEQALENAIRAFWQTFSERRGEITAVFQAAMADEDFADRWLDIRANGIRTIGRGIREAQAQGFCPGLDPLVAASALSSMIEHFCYVWQSQGGDRVRATVDEEAAVETLTQLWFHAVYWRPDDGRSR